MQNVNLVTTVKMISYKCEPGGTRIMLECPLMDARVVHNTACIKEIDAVLWFDTFMTEELRIELAERRQVLVAANISLYRSAGW